MSVQLPPFSTILNTSSQESQALTDALSLLFEPSPTLAEQIVPSLIHQIRNSNDTDQPPTNYANLIDTTINLVSTLSDDEKARFIGAHPRIGEVKGLSAMSAAEQGQTRQSSSIAPPTPTAASVLAYLNDAYERRYPGLVYITFVNGRTREEIKVELENKLREEGVLPAADESDGLERIVPHEIDDNAWHAELERAIIAIKDIAHSRLQKLDVV